MMMVSDVMNVMGVILENYGDMPVHVVNDATGEMRYVHAISTDGYEVEMEHVSYGEALAEGYIEMAEEVEEELDLIETEEELMAELEAEAQLKGMLEVLAQIFSVGVK